jgi:nitroimidazol reductase NimA-like FMN-containing flavoprotein (pyridoxamine 5'-phosphate oxidase superfamily)
MRLNPSVCIEADEVLSHFEWASVIIFGRYQEGHEVAEKKRNVACGARDHPNLLVLPFSLELIRPAA